MRWPWQKKKQAISPELRDMLDEFRDGLTDLRNVAGDLRASAQDIRVDAARKAKESRTGDGPQR